MAKRMVSPIMTWIFWSVLVLGAFLTVIWQEVVDGLSADASRVTWLILGFFIYGFFASLRVAFQLQSEFKSIRIMEMEERVVDPNASDAAALFDAALERARRGDRIETRNLITAYGAKLKGRVDNLIVISGMLITIGLLGTVIGLINTVSGLEVVLHSSSSDFLSMKDGMTRTVSGMGTAFYTTLYGALLGGVVLKVLAAEMKKASLTVVADALRFSELFIAPQFQHQASEALVQLENRVLKVRDQLESLSDGFSGVIDTIDSKQGALSESLGRLLTTVESTNAQAAERSDNLVASIATAIEDSSRHAEERVAAVTTAIAASSATADERLQTTVAAVESATTRNNEKADAELATFVKNVEVSIDSSRKSAEERLGAKASDLAGKLNEAAGMLSSMVNSVAAAEEAAKKE